MSAFTDEPVLVQPSVRRDWKRWAVIAGTLAMTALIISIPLEKRRMEAAAHHATRGAHGGVLLPLMIEGKAHSLEIAWYNNRFAPVLSPAPAPGVVLEISGRFGNESLTWNTELPAFGPGTHPINPNSHYKLNLRLVRAGRTLWQDTVLAYGYHDTHGHQH